MCHTCVIHVSYMCYICLIITNEVINKCSLSVGDTVPSKKWSLVSGGVRTTKCGTLAHGHSLHFISHGSRILSTVDLDLSTAT